MKRKAVIVALVAAVVALSAVSALALDFFGREDATSITARFSALESNETDDVFTMVSEDGEFVIHITESTPIYFEDYVPLSDECEGMTKNAREVLFGRTLAEVLEGRNLRVSFDGSEATSVIILFETAVAPPQEIDPENVYAGIVPPIGEIAPWDDFDLPVLNGEIVVNNEILEGAPLPFWQETETGDVVMIPLNVVAEALGYDVSFNDELQSIQLGVAIQIWIDSTEAHVGRMVPIELSAAPMFLDEVIYVPLDFFRNVLGQTAYVFEGQVVVETYSDMM